MGNKWASRGTRGNKRRPERKMTKKKKTASSKKRILRVIIGTRRQILDPFSDVPSPAKSSSNGFLILLDIQKATEDKEEQENL